MKENIEKAIWFAGGVSALARLLGAHHSDVSRWKHGQKPVPYKHRIRIEELTNGAIRAVDWTDTHAKQQPETRQDTRHRGSAKAGG